MDAKDIRNLSEAYLEVYAEAIGPDGRFQRDRTSASNSTTTPLTAAEVEARRERLAAAASITTPYRDSAAKRAELKTTDPEKAERQEKEAAARRMRLAGTLLSQPREQVDLYDIILSHLLDEGYAETPEAAEVIMVNMSEEWREEILDERNRGDEYATRGMSPEDAKTWKSERRNKTRGFGSDVEEKNKMDQQYKRKYGKPPAPDPNYIGSGQRRRQSDTRDNRGKRTTLVHTTSNTLSPSGIRGTITKPEIKIGTPLGGAKNPEPTGKYLRQQQIKNNPYYS